MIEPPVVRIRPSPPDPTPACAGMERPGDGRVALASAGRALMGLRGFTEDRVRNVAPDRFSAPGKPFRRRSGIPFRTAGQEPSLLVTPLSTSRAPSGHDRRADVGPEDRLHPPRLPAPTAHAGSRVRFTRAFHTRHLPSSAFRTLSTASTPQPLPGLSHPGDAPGVRVFRALLLSGGPRLSRGRCSLAVQPRSSAAKRRAGPRSPERSSPRRVRTAGDRNLPAAVALLTFAPLRRSLPPGWSLDRSKTAPCERGDELRSSSSHALHP